MTAEIFIFTNGRPTTLPAIEYGAWLGASLRTPVRLVGLDENPSPAQIDEQVHPLEAVFGHAVTAFEKYGVEYQLEVRKGHAEDVIPQRVRDEDALVVVGPLGRPPLKRLLTGRSFRELMEQVAVPMFYVPQVKLPLRKALVCLGGLGYAATVEKQALQLAAHAQAQIVLLMVVPPVDLDYPEARRVGENWEHLLETDTLSGRNLRHGLSLAREAGLTTSVKIRNGNVVEEILAEVKEGDYELLCMGSSHSSNALRQMYSPNVTAEIAESDIIPVLTARHTRPE